MMMPELMAAQAADDPRLQPVADVVDCTVDQQRLVGAVVLIAQDGRPILRKAAGFADREGGRPVRER